MIWTHPHLGGGFSVLRNRPGRKTKKSIDRHLKDGRQAQKQKTIKCVDSHSMCGYWLLVRNTMRASQDVDHLISNDFGEHQHLGNWLQDRQLKRHVTIYLTEVQNGKKHTPSFSSLFWRIQNWHLSSGYEQHTLHKEIRITSWWLVYPIIYRLPTIPNCCRI